MRRKGCEKIFFGKSRKIDINRSRKTAFHGKGERAFPQLPRGEAGGGDDNSVTKEMIF